MLKLTPIKDMTDESKELYKINIMKYRREANNLTRHINLNHIKLEKQQSYIQKYKEQIINQENLILNNTNTINQQIHAYNYNASLLQHQINQIYVNSEEMQKRQQITDCP